MRDELKRMIKTGFLINLAAILFPFVFVAPFGYFSGLLTLGDIFRIFTSPQLLIITVSVILVMFLVLRLMVHDIKKRLDSERKPGWKYFVFMGKSFFALFLVCGLLNNISGYFTVTKFVPLDFPGAGLLTVLVITGFYLTLNVPLYLYSLSASDRITRKYSRSPKIAMGIRTKLILIIGGVVLGVNLIQISVSQIADTVVAIGRVAPVPRIPMMITSGVISLTITGFVLYLMGQMIVKPITSIVDNLSQGSNGDFSGTQTISNTDETGLIGVLTNILFDSLNSGLKTVSNSVENLKKNKDHLGNAVEEIAGSIEQIRGNLQSTSNQMESHSTNVSQTTAAVEELARNIDSLGSYIEKQMESIDSADHAVKELVSANIELTKLAEESLVKTKSLTSASEEGRNKLAVMTSGIDTIRVSSQHLMEANELIASVAAQTNLLAMNAAIEAAHAGDAGKGFAVVADEIRKLAETSSDQSATINSNLKSVVDEIESVGHQSVTVEESFHDISGHVGDVGAAVSRMSEFAANVQNQSSSLKESLEEIKTVSESVAVGSREMQMGNEEILKAITDVREISGKVKEAVDEITTGADEITKLSSEMTGHNKDTDQSLNEVAVVLSAFQLKK